MSKETPRVVIAPADKMTRIKETLNRSGEVVARKVEKPK